MEEEKPVFPKMYSVHHLLVREKAWLSDRRVSGKEALCVLQAKKDLRPGSVKVNALLPEVLLMKVLSPEAALMSVVFLEVVWRMVRIVPLKLQ